MTGAGESRRLPDSEHTSRRWRIHEVAPDFRLEDVWALPTPGGPGDFPRLVDLLASLDPERSSSRATRALFALREKMGEVFRWDSEDAGVGKRVPSLRDRLPADLRDGYNGPRSGALPFSPIYLTGDEWAVETANATVHGVLHLSWVPDGAGGYRGQMAILVRPNGILGRFYMLAIMPFRYAIVYPALLREIGRSWRERGASPPAPVAA